MLPKKVGDMLWDKSNSSIQIASGFKTSDATLPTPQTSPLAVTGAITIIDIPENAVELIIAPSVDVNISEDPTITTYDVVIAESKEAIGVSQMDKIYIQTSTGGAGTLFFRFSLI